MQRYIRRVNSSAGLVNGNSRRRASSVNGESRSCPAKTVANLSRNEALEVTWVHSGVSITLFQNLHEIIDSL